MRLRLHSRIITFTSLVCAAVLVADSPALAENSQRPVANTSLSSTAGLILQEYEGELRVRRPREKGGVVGIPTFIIKVDRKCGDSSSFFMGMEDIPPGKKIRLHHHPHAEEILFMHRGSGIVRLEST